MTEYLVLGVFVVMVLQLSALVMLRVYSNRHVTRSGDLLREQSENIRRELIERIERSITAAHDAYKEANTVNEKISDLNKRLMEQSSQPH